MFNMVDSGAHSLETERMQQVIDKQERDIRALVHDINFRERREKEQTEAIQVLKDEVIELRQRNKELEVERGPL